MQVGAGVVVGAVGGGVAESVSGGGVMEQGLSWLQHEPDPWHLALESLTLYDPLSSLMPLPAPFEIKPFCDSVFLIC